MSVHLDRLIAAMSKPGFYPHRPGSVQVIQTHISAIFIAGDLVYKIKKPVGFGFLDFTTLEKRRFFCQREVVLNSRFSEGVYLGVVSIHEDASEINLEGRGREIEVAVLMRHLPEERIMLKMLDQDRVTHELLDRLADRVASIHSASPTGPGIATYGSFEVITQNVRENFDQTESYVDRTIDPQTRQAVLDLAIDFMRGHRDLFERRIVHGFIKDCHGDLHLDHVVILNGIVLFDCIEFNDRFRYGDTASDIGFLLMDLDFRGFPAFGERVSHRYAATSGDDDVLKLLGFYKAYRAFVRGKVLGFTLDEPEVSQAEKDTAAQTARDYFALSLSCLLPPPRPALIITSGLTGTGKSFLADKLGKRLGIQALRSDVIRKQILGLPTTEHHLDKYGEWIYTSTSTEAAYRVLLDRARKALTRNESVILDASFMRGADRIAARKIAAESKAQFRILECMSPEDVAFQRLRQRARSKNEPSDGRWEIYREQRQRFEPVADDELPYWRQWDSTKDPNPFLMRLVREVMTQG